MPVMPSNNTPPLFSVIVLYWKGSQYIQRCLDSLNQQTFRDFEVILIDNASPESLPDGVLDRYPQINLRHRREEKNLGFAGGNNLGASLAKGQYLALLNSDAFPKPDWLENVLTGTQKYPDCSLASRLIIADRPDRLDGEGDIYHISGLVWHRSYQAPVAQGTTSEVEVFSACGAAAVYPRSAFDLVDGFDPDYFAYTEDIDLGFRLRLAGVRCIYLPNAEVLHVGSGSSGPRSPQAVYYHQRNMVWTFFKNMPGLLLAIFLPLHIAVNTLLALNSLINTGKTVYLKAKWDAITGLPKILRKRQSVQCLRKVSLSAILAVMDTNLLSPLREGRRK